MSAHNGFAENDWCAEPQDFGKHLVKSWKGISCAISVSVLLHVVILTSLFYIQITRPPIQTDYDPLRRVMTVSLVKKSRGEILPDPAIGKPQTKSTDRQELPEPADVPGQPLETSVAVNEIPHSRDADVPEPSANGIADSESESEGEQRSFGPDNIRAVITGYVESQHGIQTRQYVEECIRYRNRHGQNNECPGNRLGGGLIDDEREIAARIFEAATSNADHERRRVRLEAYDKVLLAIMDEGGPAAEQAKIRWSLNRQYQIYLGNNINAQLLHMSQTQFVNDYNQVFTARPYQFRCNKIPLPCKYRYTGFDARAMGNYEEEEPSFREVTPLFMPKE